ncbi:hypothetical protein CTI14_43820, partial [Methylobacterium radiotolerans]
MSYMFQADALFPWKSVLANVMMGPVLLGTPKREATELARDWLRRVGLAGFRHRHGRAGTVLLDRRPHGCGKSTTLAQVSGLER